MEDFVQFELAKKLKEKGYPQRTFGKYDMIGSCYIEDGRFYENGCITEVARAYTAPTISQVLKWLREEKKIHVEISPQWQYTVYDMRCSPWIGRSDMQNYDDYTKAAIAGIEYVIDNLI